MFAKIAVLACLLAVANAGAIGVATYAAPAYTSYSAPTYTSYSAPAYTSYSAPALTATSENVYRSAGNLQSISTQSRSIATPFSSSNKQFTSVTNPGVYAHVAPVATYAHVAPVATYAHVAPVATYAKYAAAPALAYAAPAAPAPAPGPGPVAHGGSLLGVAYSPAVAVSHMTYSSPLGVNYSY